MVDGYCEMKLKIVEYGQNGQLTKISNLSNFVENCKRMIFFQKLQDRPNLSPWPDARSTKTDVLTF